MTTDSTHLSKQHSWGIMKASVASSLVAGEQPRLEGLHF